MVSVERLLEYTSIDQEAPSHIPHNAPPNSWPEKGNIKFKGFKMRYREGLDYVLKGFIFILLLIIFLFFYFILFLIQE